MKIEGQRTYLAGREVIGTILNDPAAISRLLPGCETFEPVSPGVYRLVADIRLGRSLEHFSGEVSLAQLEPSRSFAFETTIPSPGCQGRVELKEASDGATTLTYEVSLTPGQALPVSPRMLETTARSFARRALDALEKEVAIRTRVYTTTAGGWDAPSRTSSPDAAIHRLTFARRALGLGLIMLVVWFLSRGVARRNTRRARQQIAEVVSQVLEQVDAAPVESSNGREAS